MGARLAGRMDGVVGSFVVFWRGIYATDVFSVCAVQYGRRLSELSEGVGFLYYFYYSLFLYSSVSKFLNS